MQNWKSGKCLQFTTRKVMSETSGIDLVTKSFVSLCIFLAQDRDQNQYYYDDQNISLVKILH